MISAMITSLSRLLDEFSISSKVISIPFLAYSSMLELSDLCYKSCFDNLNISDSVICVLAQSYNLIITRRSQKNNNPCCSSFNNKNTTEKVNTQKRHNHTTSII